MFVLLNRPFVRPGGDVSAPILFCSGVRTVRENAANKNTPASITGLPRGHKKPLSFCSLKRGVGRGGVGGRNEVSLLVLFLSVGDDVNQVLVVQVSSHIWGEGGEHLLHLKGQI